MKIILFILISTVTFGQNLSFAPNITKQNGIETPNLYAKHYVGAQTAFTIDIKLSKTFAITTGGQIAFNRYGWLQQTRNTIDGEINGDIEQVKYFCSVGLPVLVKISANKNLSASFGGLGIFSPIRSEMINPLSFSAIATVQYKSIFIQYAYGLSEIERNATTKINSIALGFAFKL